MMKKRETKVVYYSTYNEDFDGFSYEEKKIDGSYEYERRSGIGKLLSAFLYRVLATPFAFLYTRLVTKDRVIGGKGLPKRGCYFLYLNHTQPIADALSPGAIAFPKRASVVISPKNLDMPILGKALPYLGGIPLPNDRSSLRGFREAINSSAERSEAIAIYPEGHLWPFCTEIRPFNSACFTYPVRLGAPVYTATRVYKKRRRGYRCLIYIDGPFIASESLNANDAREELCLLVRKTMKMRAALSDYCGVRYVKKDAQESEDRAPISEEQK